MALSKKVGVGNFMWGTLAALMAITSLSTDIYLPAMPQMMKDLQGDIELTITGFLVGFSIGQLFWGPISDRYGRKLPMTIGLLLFIIGSIGCALSTTIVEIVLFRVFQAFGACVGPMLSRAMVRDTLEKIKAAEMLSTLMTLMAIAPIIGPLIGGQLLKFTTWHSIFWLLALIGFLMLIAAIRLPETLPNKKRKGTSLWEAFKKYKILFRKRDFMVYTLCVTFYYVAVYAFVAGSPLVYINFFGLSPEDYGWLFAVNIVGIAALSFINRYLVRRYTLDNLLKTSTAISMLAGLLLVTMAYTGFGGLWSIAISVFFVLSMNGVIAACSTASALDKVPEMAGAGSALLGALQYGSGIVSTLLLAFFGNGSGNPLTMGWIISLFTILAALMAFYPKKEPGIRIEL